MDSLENFSPLDTCGFSVSNMNDTTWLTIYTAGFININAIRLKMYGVQKAEEGQSLNKV
jgi:hypothetical protein